MDLTRRGLLGAGGALALTPGRRGASERRIYHYRREGWAGGVDVTAPATLGPSLLEVEARPGPAPRTDAEVVRIDVPTPDLMCVSAPGRVHDWSLRIHRPPGEPEDWADVVLTTLLVTLGPTSCWMGLGVSDVAGEIDGPVWASTLRVAALLAPGRPGPWFAPLSRRAVRPDTAEVALTLLRWDRMAEPWVSTMWALRDAMHRDARSLESVAGEWQGPEELQVVLLQRRGDDGLQAAGAGRVTRL